MIYCFVESKTDIEKRLIKRPNFNRKIINKFKKIQYSAAYKKEKNQISLLKIILKKSLNESIKKY